MSVDPDSLPDPHDLSEEQVLARTLWGEARGEKHEGRVAVACVILNRAARAQAHRRRKGTRFWWGETPKEVCLQPLQFSCWNGSDQNLPKMLAVTEADKAFADCLAIARDALAGRLVDNTGGATHYINPKLVDPSWAKSMIETARIGRHAFYRETRG
ncbi:MAG: cell wall hydrolase [Magnetospirillum sp. WYHS-4]